MTHILYISFILIMLTACSSKQKFIEVDEKFHNDSINGIYIPKDINDCIEQLDTFWSDSIKQEIKKKNEQLFLAEAHLGIGMWIRNNWNLWGKGSRLSMYFNEYEVYHPDDISAIILISYHRYLTGRNINFEKQIEESLYSNTINKTPNKKQYPKNASKNLEFNTKLIYSLNNSKENRQGVVHMGVDPSKDEYWVYDYSYGWKKINKDLFNQLKNSSFDSRYEIVKKIYQEL